MGTKLKFGFDIHGVIDDLPETFVALNNALYDAGHEIHIITGASACDEIFKQLRDLGVKWHKYFSIVDFQKSQGTSVTYDEKNTPWLDPDKWNRTKADYCKENDISLHFDDTPEYEPFFTTPFARVYTKNNRNGRGLKKKESAIKTENNAN